MAEETELELLITVVVAAADDRSARAACRDFLRIFGGRIVESSDCSDEEPQCWSVTISRSAPDSSAAGEAHAAPTPAQLSQAVQGFLQHLGPDYQQNRVCCEPPTAWTVLDGPDDAGQLIPGAERIMIEAWFAGSDLPLADPEEVEEVAEPQLLDDVDDEGHPRPRISLIVDVVTERQAKAEWQALALAARISRQVELTAIEALTPMLRVHLDLGPAVGTLPQIVTHAAELLGGTGWSRLRNQAGMARMTWIAAPTPPSGIAGVDLSARFPADLPHQQRRERESNEALA